jgi:hypothetical protein
MLGTCIEVYIIDTDRTIKVKHEFYGRTEAEAREYLEHHLQSCTYFKGAWDAGDIIEVVDDEAELPTPESVREDFDEDE